MRVNYDKPDSLDAQYVDEMLASPGWRLLMKRIEEMDAQHSRELRAATTWDDTRYLQGRAAELECIVSLPRQLIKEARDRALKRHP